MRTLACSNISPCYHLTTIPIEATLVTAAAALAAEFAGAKKRAKAYPTHKQRPARGGVRAGFVYGCVLVRMCMSSWPTDWLLAPLSRPVRPRAGWIGGGCGGRGDSSALASASLPLV